MMEARVGVPELRRRIDLVDEPLQRYCLIYLYLTASRANEAASVQQPSDKNTVAIGPRKKDITFDTYEGRELFRISIGTLKRRGRPARIVALPLGGVEPWADYLARQFQKLDNEDSLVPYSRTWLNEVLRRWGFNLKSEKASMKNPLRHIRINHLLSFYGLSPVQVTVYAGWEMGSAIRGFGGSGTAAAYIAQNWQDYFPRLLKPLP